jgi:DNA-directed RNA polymerase specialized sigma24 family protein
VREESAVHALDELRAERDDQVRQAYRDGLQMSEIAAALGLSPQRIYQLVRG